MILGNIGFIDVYIDGRRKDQPDAGAYQKAYGR